jgi:hypothetical protein
MLAFDVDPRGQSGLQAGEEVPVVSVDMPGGHGVHTRDADEALRRSYALTIRHRTDSNL